MSSTPEPTGLALSQGAPAPDYAAMKRELAQRLEAGGSDVESLRAVLVSVEGETKMSYYRSRTAKDYAHVYSVTKSVISILVGIAVGEGKLRLNQMLAELLPEHAAAMPPQATSITLRQLLTMTAGVSGSDGVLDVTVKETVDLILTLGITGDPGVDFEYGNSGAHLVAVVLRKAVGTTVLEYAREKVFDPLGIDTRPGWQGWDVQSGGGFTKAGFGWATDRAGTNLGGYGLKLTAPDMIKIGELFVNGGRWKGRQIVSEQWVQESTTPKLTEDQAGVAGNQDGYFWWVADLGGHAGFVAAGSFYQMIVSIPDLRAVVVVTCSDAKDSYEAADQFLDPLLEEVVLRPLTR